ncbi:hypothetical protein ACSVDA_15715 [Cytobacillus sp. Hm23]
MKTLISSFPFLMSMLPASHPLIHTSLAITSDDKLVYAVGGSQDGVNVIDVKTHSLIATVSV